MKNKTNKKGFTLTELIVVIVIIGILAIVLIPTLTGYIKKANESADEQTVAGLNKLLLDAKINDVEFNDILEVKEYLKDEMEYNGEYSLKIKGNYIWFDEEETQFVILGEEDLSSLKAADSTYVLNDKLTSPEGLLKDSVDSSVLWLAGGNGDLLKVVEEIRNIGNSGEALKEFNKLDNNAIKELFTVFFNEYGFVGTKGTYVVNNGEVVKYDADQHGEKNILVSSLAIEGIKLFHEDVVKYNISKINAKLVEDGAPCRLEFDSSNEYQINVILLDDGGFMKAALAIYEVLNILIAEGTETGFIIPQQFEDIKNYESIISEITNSYNGDKTLMNEFLYLYTSSLLENKSVITSKDLDVLYKVDLIGEEEEVLNNAINILLFALNFTKKDLGNNEYQYYLEPDFPVSGANALVGRNDLTLFGYVNSDKYGEIMVEYDFHFELQK